MTAPIKPGDTVKVLEGDYLYGVGDLILRVTEVGDVQSLPDDDWLAVEGVQLSWDGVELENRRVLVRLSALTRRLRLL